jgi:hypothetical protein
MRERMAGSSSTVNQKDVRLNKNQPFDPQRSHGKGRDAESSAVAFGSPREYAKTKIRDGESSAVTFGLARRPESGMPKASP